MHREMLCVWVDATFNCGHENLDFGYSVTFSHTTTPPPVVLSPNSSVITLSPATPSVHSSCGVSGPAMAIHLFCASEKDFNIIVKTESEDDQWSFPPSQDLVYNQTCDLEGEAHDIIFNFDHGFLLLDYVLTLDFLVIPFIYRQLPLMLFDFLLLCLTLFKLKIPFCKKS